MSLRYGLFALAMLVLATPVQAAEQDGAADPVRVVVNGDPVKASQVDARQYDMIGKSTIVPTVLNESRRLSRSPAVARDLKSLLAVTVQKNPKASKEEIMKIVEETSIQYTQVLAVRSEKPKLFAKVEDDAVNALIDDQLKLQAAAAASVSADEAALSAAVENAEKRAGAADEPLHKLLTAWDNRALPGLKHRLRAQLAWKAVLEKKHGNEIADFDAVSAKELAALREKAKIERR